MARQTIAANLSALWNTQILMSLPDPRDNSSFAVLRRVQAGINQVRVYSSTHQRCVRLPITVAMLGAIRAVLDAASDQERELVWAVVSLAFFGFFHLGELLVDADSACTEATHLSWGDVVVNSQDEQSMLRVHLKQ